MHRKYTSFWGGGGEGVNMWVCYYLLLISRSHAHGGTWKIKICSWRDLVLFLLRHNAYRYKIHFLRPLSTKNMILSCPEKCVSRETQENERKHYWLCIDDWTVLNMHDMRTCTVIVNSARSGWSSLLHYMYSCQACKNNYLPSFSFPWLSSCYVLENVINSVTKSTL